MAALNYTLLILHLKDTFGGWVGLYGLCPFICLDIMFCFSHSFFFFFLEFELNYVYSTTLWEIVLANSAAVSFSSFIVHFSV